MTKKPGRPSSYKPEYAARAAELCGEKGATDAKLAEAFGVSTQTITSWKAAHPEFLASLKGGKGIADDKVERCLFDRATGYTFDSEKIHVLRDGTVVRVPVKEHVPPDTTAMIFWLKNRRPVEWRDRREVDVRTGTLDGMAPDDLNRLREELASERARRAAGGTDPHPAALPNVSGHGTA